MRKNIKQSYFERVMNNENQSDQSRVSAAANLLKLDGIKATIPALAEVLEWQRERVVTATAKGLRR